MAAEDEAVAALNATLPHMVDHALGCGFLEGHVKQRLVKLKRVRFCSDAETKQAFDSEEDTSRMKIEANVRLFAELAGDGTEGLRAHIEMAAGSQSTHATKMAIYTYTRVIAKRSIAVPQFAKLLPVRKKTHVDKDGRWRVERFGNQLCTTEQYGAKINIVFTWNIDSKVSTAMFTSKLKAGIADKITRIELANMLNMTQVKWTVHDRGFSHQASVTRTLTTVEELMAFIGSLGQLPIKCAVPVGVETVPVVNVDDFPHDITVETQIRDQGTLDKLDDVLQRLAAPEQRNPRAFAVVEYLMAKVEDASLQDRALLPKLRDIAEAVVQTCADHGKCAHLYERRGEYRLYEDNCNSKSITSTATVIAAALTAGASIPVVRTCQASCFDRAPVWTAPEHYELHVFNSTSNESDYYRRVKVRLHFNSDELVSSWRGQINEVCARSPPVRLHRARLWERIVSFCRCHELPQQDQW